ncbi:MAG TPA: tRNA pseudouridine(55) synthase TruB [Hyphomicrobiaceae bacterium]|nr:tRNA pseudouridine(55) synthase TruB [Hyphomicrobiaceae bacterium]
MGKRKRGKPVHGWVILDKPLEMTSTQAVGFVRRMFDAQKAGHAGTLDPLATGVLPIALGEATKTVPYAVDGDKIYRFTVRWGVETTTDDREGAIVQQSDTRPAREAILALLPEFTGDILQTPPQFSAIKIDGERAYDIARSGEDVKLEARPVSIDELRLDPEGDADHSVFTVRCGRGTYVRALARDMGRRLGCYGHVAELRRTLVGAFSEERSVTVEEIRAAAEADDGGVMLAKLIEPVHAVLEDLTGLAVTPDDAGRLARGQAILIRGRDAPILKGEAYATCRGQIVALGELERGEFVPTRVFNFG